MHAEASLEFVIVCQCPGAIYMFEIVKNLSPYPGPGGRWHTCRRMSQCPTINRTYCLFYIWNNLFDRNTSILYYKRQLHTRRKKRVHYIIIKNYFIHMHMSILDRITWQAFPFKRKLYQYSVDKWKMLEKTAIWEILNFFMRLFLGTSQWW